MNNLSKTLIAAPVLALAMSGCNDGSTSNNGSTGTLNLAVTDAPVDDALQVWITFTGVELKPTSGNAFDIDFATPKEINLLDLQGSDFSFLVEDETILSGTYNWMRLKVKAERDTITGDSYLVNSTGTHSLYIPSGSETGLKLHNAFTIMGGSVNDLTIDFDLRKSIHKPQGAVSDYVLKPSLRLVQDQTSGHITGTVPTIQAADAACTSAAVYLFEGENVTPTDEGPTEPNPITTSLVKYNIDSASYEYEIGFVPAGNYTIAFTCVADTDEPTTDEEITFLSSDNVSVTYGSTATFNFPEPTP